jgi:hypothetical protein
MNAMNRLSVFFLGIFLLGCENKSAIEQKIFDLVNENCTSFPCNVALSDILNGDWKKLYVFKPTATLEDIEKALGFQYPFWDDVGKRFIFVNSENKIVYQEVMFPTYSGLSNDDIIFPMKYEEVYRLYENAPFIVEKINFPDGHYYTLVQ